MNDMNDNNINNQEQLDSQDNLVPSNNQSTPNVVEVKIKLLDETPYKGSFMSGSF